MYSKCSRFSNTVKMLEHNAYKIVFSKIMLSAKCMNMPKCSKLFIQPTVQKCLGLFEKK